MDRFFGFDLGDAESALTRMDKEGQAAPSLIPVDGEESFITAYSAGTDGQIQIGEKACYSGNVIRRGLRFKSRFLTDSGAAEDIRIFSAAVLGLLYADGSLRRDEDCCFYVGCPAGWDSNSRELYREIFEKAGYPPVKIVSESRAALVSACQSRHLQVGYNILSRPVLVVDIGSSTTDFAYICGGHEVEMQTAGEVSLGGGKMDEALLDRALDQSSAGKKLRDVFRESQPWRSYCEFAARRLKEKYYQDEEYWAANPCTQTILVRYGRPLKLTLRMDEQTAAYLTDGKLDNLGGRSFHEEFVSSLEAVARQISGQEPELIFLTGGVSRMKAVRQWCRQVFPRAVVISGAQPEFSIAVGLAWSARIDEDMRDFRNELEELRAGRIVEEIVSGQVTELYTSVVSALIGPILENAAQPVFERWRSGEIERLADVDDELEREIGSWLHSEDARNCLRGPVSAWMRPVCAKVEEYTTPICARHHVPYSALSLTSFFAASDLNIRVEARNIFAVDEMTLLIDSVISILVGLICGGGGVALISSGPAGILAGMIVSIVVLFLGRNRMEEALLQAKIPRLLRKTVPRHALRSREESIAARVRDNFRQALDRGDYNEVTAQLVDDISRQIEQCLIKMAQIVEIPLG